MNCNPKGNKQTPNQILHTVSSRPQPIPLTQRGNPANVPLGEEYVQRSVQYSQQGNPALRPSLHPHSIPANSNNPHDMSKQQLPSQPGLPGSNPQGHQMIFPTHAQAAAATYYQQRQNQSRTVQNVNQRAPPMNVSMNPQGAPQPQQASYFHNQLPPNMIPMSHLHPMAPQQMYAVQGNVSQVQTVGQQYRPPYQQQQYQISPQPQTVYIPTGTAPFAAYGGAATHNTTVFYHQQPMMNRPQSIPAQPQHPPKRERKLIRIQDPDTERDLTEELVGRGSSSNTPPASGPSSARETPPTSTSPPPKTSDIAVQFATQVAVVAAAEPTKENHSQSSARTVLMPSEKPPDLREPTKVSLAKHDGTSVNHSKVLEKQSDSVLPQRVTEPKPISVATRSSPSLPVTLTSMQVIEVDKSEQQLLHKNVVDVSEPLKTVVYVATPPEITKSVPNFPPPVTVSETIPTVQGDVPLVLDVLQPESETEADVEVDEVEVAVELEVEVEEESDHQLVVDENSESADADVQEEQELSEDSIPRENGDLMQAQDQVDQPLEKWEYEAKDPKKQKGRKKQHYLNRKGESKEGGDMDAFVDKEEGPPNVAMEASSESSSVVDEMSFKEEQRKVAEKNEENAKVSREYERNDQEENPVIEQEPLPKQQQPLKYNYKEDQWSPLNPEGKRQYDRAFLLHMQSQPMSLKKPEGLPDLEVIKDTINRVKPFETRAPPGPSGLTRNIGVVPDFTPGYVKSSTPRGGGGGGGGPIDVAPTAIPSRFQAQMRGGRSSQQSKPPPEQKGRKIFSLSLSQEVKLNKSENAWRPTHKLGKDVDPELALTEDLYKKVRGILNKLTPQKFQMLVDQVNSLTINTEERLKGVIDLVFEKAIDEPSFSVAYANLCKCLALMKVPVGSKETDHVNFRKVLLNKCQKEFERDITEEVDREKRVKEIENTESEERKKELQEELIVNDTKSRRRSLGNIRFIGELFKLNMLTANIMHDCLKKLLTQEDEDSLECLCRLLITIGKDMDMEKGRTGAKPEENKMNGYFKLMKEIINKRQTSSRVRFMLQDVMELRLCHWIPRRDENNPKTIDQIHQEAEREAMEREFMLTQPSSHRRSEDREKRGKRAGPGAAGAGAGAGAGEDGWNTVGSKNSTRIDANKLKLSKLTVLDDENIQLGPGGRNSVGWSRGSSGGSRTSSQEPDNKPSMPVNRFQALAGSEQSLSDSRRGATRTPTPSGRDSSKGRGGQMLPSSQRNKPMAPSQKEREQAIAAVKTIAGGEVGRPQVGDSRESSVSREENKPDAPESILKGSPELTEEEVEKKAIPLINEFLHNCDFQEAIVCVSEVIAPSTAHYFVTTALNEVLDRSPQARHLIGTLMRDLVKKKMLTVENFNHGVQALLGAADDYVIDIPQFWDFFGELIAPVFIDGTIPLRFLHMASSVSYDSGRAGTFVAAVLHAMSKTMGQHKVGEMWQASDLIWSNFLKPDQNEQKFLESSGLEFTVQLKEHKVEKQLTTEEIKKELDTLLRETDNNEKIFDWIHTNVGEARSHETAFVRALMTAVSESVIDETNNTIDSKVLTKRCPVLMKILDNKEERELQALYALQALMHRLLHPSGMLCSMFDILFDQEVISEDAFTMWESSDDPAEVEGKGVAVRSVKSFYTWLNNVENDSAEES